MQESPVFPHWIQTALGWLAPIIAGGAIHKLVLTWLNRRKPAAEIHLTEATAAEITVRAGSNAGDAVIRMMDRLDAAQITIDKVRGDGDRLRGERDDWRVRALNAEADADAARMFTDQLNAAGRLAVCEHYPNGVRLQDYTPQQLKSVKS